LDAQAEDLSQQLIGGGQCDRHLGPGRGRPEHGAEVVAYREAGVTTDGKGKSVVVSGTHERFIGVYSGRVSNESDIEIVWKARVVPEIVEAALQRPAPKPGPSA